MANTQPQKRALWRCLVAGFLLIVLAFGVAVYRNATSTEAFENLLLQNIDHAGLGTDEPSLRGFARETIQYLTGERMLWNPQISIDGFPAGSFIPQSFHDHMKDVRDGFGLAKTVFRAALAGVVLLLGSIALGGKKSAKKLPPDDAPDWELLPKETC